MASKHLADFKKENRSFWYIPLVLILIQSLFVFQSFEYIRYEDLAESIRNPFWLQHHTIYDGTSSNVGWYATLLFIYKVFGFHLYTARYYKILVYSAFICTTAFFLKKYFGIKRSRIPLITIGLSPTLLYLNTFQTAFAVDIQYAVIMFGFVLTLSPNKRKNLLTIFGLGALAMWSSMSYPSGLFTLPALALALYFKLRTLALTPKEWLISILVGSVGFIFPFLLMLAYLSDPGRLLNDPVGGQGIFRGSGRVATDFIQFKSHTQDNLADLFLTGITNQFELPHVEFSNLYPIAALAVVFFLSKSLFFQTPKNRPIILVSLILIFSSFIGTGLSSWGLRTNAPSLIGIYGLFTIVWVSYYPKWKVSPANKAVMVMLSFITIHHLLNLYPGYQFVGQPSKVSYQLSNLPASPDKQLNSLVSSVQIRPLTLSCQNNQGQLISCRYQEIYAAVAGACLWNNLPCKSISGYDVKTGNFLKLEPNLWVKYYWAH